jgi:hypothetical protein
MWAIELPRALPGETCAVAIAREMRWDSRSRLLNQHWNPGQYQTFSLSNWVP